MFLLGDAAHLNPPFGGHGLNTGIGDAVDLGWKIAACLQGWGGPGLLSSYDAERRPLHQRVVDEASANRATLAPQLLRGDLDDPGPAGTAARQAAAEIRAAKTAEHFAPDLVLGYRYRDSPVMIDDPDTAGNWPTTVLPGGLLRHDWVRPGVSTLDLVGPGFTLFLLDGAGAPAPAAQVDVVVLSDPELATRWGARAVLVRPDQIVAWRGDAVPTDLPALLALVSGGQEGDR